MLNLKHMRKGEKGITGLETAIILIAFVVVAAVFAYTALSAGLFSTQKAQEAVYSGLKEARSTLELRGGIVATAGTEGGTGVGTIKQLSFTVSSALGGEAIDFEQPSVASDNGGLALATGGNKVVINYIDKAQRKDNLYWQVTRLGSYDDDYLLEDGEKFQITIGNEDTTQLGGNLLDALATDLSVNTTFSLVVLTPAGAVLEIERTTPAYIDTKINLH